MAIDVRAEVSINRSRQQEVAEYAMNPDYDPVWIGGISEAKMITDPPLREGTQVSRVASFLGKRIDYVLEVVGHEPASLLAMRSVKGPFPMKVTYEFEEASGGTMARIRVEGEAGGFYKLASPLMSRSVKHNITKDLRTLKQLLESMADKS